VDSGRKRLSVRREGAAALFLLLLALGAGTLVELGRQSGIPAWQSIWAEDGEIFLSDAIAKPFPDVVWHPYAGYMLVVPRLAAEIVALPPLEDAAWMNAIVASSLVAAVALFVYHASAVVLGHKASRAALAAIVLLLPTAGFEATANLANTHWYLVFACFWALVDTRRTPRALAARTLFAAAAPLSNPLAALLIPLVFTPSPLRASRRELVPRGAFLVGVCLQVLVVLRASDTTPTNPFRPSDLPEVIGGRVAGAFLVGDRLLDLAGRSLGTMFTATSVLITATLFYVVIRSSDRLRRRFALLAGGYSAVFLFVPLAVRGSTGYWPIVDGALAGSRYFVLPVLFLFVALVVYVDALLLSPPSVRRTTLLTAIALWCGTVLLVNYSIPNPRSDGPDWQTSLLRARRACERGKLRYTNVPIAPAGWSVHVSCHRVT
jgi:hypothetical protein